MSNVKQLRQAPADRDLILDMEPSLCDGEHLSLVLLMALTDDGEFGDKKQRRDALLSLARTIYHNTQEARRLWYLAHENPQGRPT